MNKIIYYITSVLILSLSLSCETSNVYQKEFVENDKKEKILNTACNLDDICHNIEKHIAAKYFDIDKKPKIKISLNKVKSNLNYEPLLPKYIYNHIESHINQQSQFIIVPSNDPAIDSIIELHLIKGHNRNIEILSNILDAKDKIVTYSKKYDFKVSELKSKRYLSYKKYYKEPVPVREREDKENAYLLVTGINITDKYEEDDEYLLYDRFSNGLTESYVLEFDPGYTTLYPTEQKITLNGKTFEMDYKTNILYNNYIETGTIEIIASFREGLWDAKEQHQYLRKEYSKVFYVKLNKNDNIKLDISFICTFNRKVINVKAYKKKEIKKDRAIETYYEVIDVFSN